MKKSIFALIAFVGFATSTFAGNDNTDKTKNTGTTCIQTIKFGVNDNNDNTDKTKNTGTTCIQTIKLG